MKFNQNFQLSILKLLFILFLINNFTAPPVPPLPPPPIPGAPTVPSIDGLPPFIDVIPSCNFVTNTIITPTSGLLKKARNSYIVAPSSTTTYTITSWIISPRITPPDPGVSLASLCQSGIPVTDEFTVIVEDCEPVNISPLNSLIIDYETEYYICYGDTIQTGTPPRHAPAYIFTETLSLHPTPGAPNEQLSSIWYYQQYNCPPYNEVEVIPDENWEGLYPSLFPSVTTEYLITHRVTNDPNCTSSLIRKIKVNIVCSAKNNHIAKDYPWLATLTNNDACEFSSIEVYEKGSSKYIYISSSDGKTLYFQNGTMLCKDSPNYDCIEAYQLTNLVKSWSCDQASDDTANDEQEIFNNYSWLNNLIDQGNCNDEVVTVYDAGSYKFVLIQNSMGDRLYDASGKFYCFSSTGFSFLDGYGESSIVEQWACNGHLSGRKAAATGQSFEVFPNPTKGKVSINLQEHFNSNPVVTIYDVSGKKVLQIQPASVDLFASVFELDVSDFDKGMYLVEVHADYITKTEKLVIE